MLDRAMTICPWCNESIPWRTGRMNLHDSTVRPPRQWLKPSQRLSCPKCKQPLKWSFAGQLWFLLVLPCPIGNHKHPGLAGGPCARLRFVCNGWLGRSWCVPGCSNDTSGKGGHQVSPRFNPNHKLLTSRSNPTFERNSPEAGCPSI